MPPLDEDRRRQFERHRRAGGGDALDTFLPEPSSPTFEATLEELVLIDLEMAWKAWHAGGAVGAPPALDDHLERWAHLRQPSVRARLQHESAWLGAHYRPDALRAGVHLGRYALQERIGQGSCAEVWRAWDDDLGRDVALKVPHASVALGSQTMARARREALAAAGLRHPGIVTVHGVEEHAGRPFFVLEFVRGRTLAGAQTEVQADRAGAVRLLARVADAIGYAHAMGVIHRDLKPANILLDAQGQPRVTDFGLARLAAGRGDLTQHGEVLGTPAYMAPEQARGATAEVGPAADIYSMGVLLYELLSGRRPFEGVTAEATLYSVVHEEAPPLRRIVPDLPIDLDTITGKAMAREAGRRYASAMELAADLRRYLAHRPIEARRVGVVERGVLWVRRNPVLAATVLTSVLAIFSVAGVGFRNVLEERGRFRQERDRAEGNLLRSLLGEASALREAQGVDWRVRAMALLRSAAPLAKDAAERLRVRNLVAACASTHGPAFHRVAIWDTGDGAARSVASDADGARIAVVTRRGGLRVLGTGNGDTVLFVPPGDVKATALDWVGQGDGLVVGFADGHLEMRGGDALSLRATTPPTGSEVHAVAGHPEALLAAVGHAGGSIQLVGWSDDADDLVLLQRLAGHEGGTLALAFSADGEHLLSGGVDHATCLWAWREGRAVTTVLDLDPVRFVAFHGAQGALSATYEQYGFRLVDLATGRQLEPLDPSGMHARPVTGLEVDRERHVLTTAADGTLSIWTARRLGRRVQFERVHHGLTGMGPITACAVLGEDGDLVAAHEDGRLSRWRRRPAAVTHRWATGQEAAFLPGTHVLATTNGLWSYTSGAPPQEWPWTHDRVLEFLIPTGRGTIACLHASGATQHLTDEGPVPWTRVSDVSAAAALADGADLVLGTRSGEIVIVPTAPGAAVRHLDAHRGAILALAAPPGEGAACYVLGQSGLAVLRVDGERWERLDDRPRERGVLAAGGDLLAVGEPDGAVTLWDARRGVHVRSLSGDAQAPMRCLSLSTAGELLLGIDDEGTAHLWQTDSGAIVWSVEGPRVASPQCRIDTGLGAAVLLRGGPEVLHLRSGRPAATVPLLASAVAIDRGGDRLVVAGRRGGAWSIGLPAVRDALEMVAAPAEPARRTAPRTLALEQELLPGGHPDSIWGLAVSPDARWIATSGHHGAVVLRDARTGHQLRTLDSFGALAWTVSFSPDSRVLAVGAGHDVRLYAVATGEEVGRLQGHDGLVTSIAFHPEAPLIVTSSQDRSVRMWDATAGTAAGTLDVDAAVVSELEFDPGAVWLAAACADGSVLFWDARPASLAPGAAPVRRWSGHGTAAWTLAFDSRGALLASGSEDGQILLRDVRTGETRIELRGEPRLRSLSFTSDGRYLAGACWSAPSTTWDLASLGAELTSLGAAWGNDGLLPHDLTPR